MQTPRSNQPDWGDLARGRPFHYKLWTRRQFVTLLSLKLATCPFCLWTTLRPRQGFPNSFTNQRQTRYSKLSPVTPSPLYDWDCAYGLPSDFSRLLTFNSFPASAPNDTFQIVGAQLYTDISEAVISYIRIVEDPNLFDPLFVDALVMRLAAKLARPLAGSLEIERAMNSQFEKSLAEARRIDAGQGIPRRKMLWVNSDLVNARFSEVT